MVGRAPLEIHPEVAAGLPGQDSDFHVLLVAPHHTRNIPAINPVKMSIDILLIRLRIYPLVN